jgi:glycosyltransferase involved in cell wall biosynthesis
MVVRLHSYEAFTAIPYFVNWGGVDGMIFVSEPIRRFFFDQHQERLEGIPWIVAGNAMSRVSVPSSRRTSGGRTLGMLKFADSNKDPIEALRILSALRNEDPAWSLRLAGDAWPDDKAMSPRELEYKNDFFAFIGSRGLDGAVVFDGYQDDPMSWLAGVDFILSCSQREGTHEALLDGVAAGCIPIIRNWPMLARYGGPKALYPELSGWVFSTTEEAVELITRPRSTATAPPHSVLEVTDSSAITEFLRAVALDNAPETAEPEAAATSAASPPMA